MNIARNLMTVGTFAASLLVLPGVDAEVLRSKELICSGVVTYGQKTFTDQIILRLSDNEVEVTGQSGMTSTFEGMLRYKICSESENGIDFEYTTSHNAAAM